MPTDHTARNRANAAHSTGPRTPEGKAAAARNALRHGLLSQNPIATTCEHEEDWLAHRTAVCSTLAPADYFESALAERIALLHWRLARVARLESALIDAEQTAVQTRLEEHRFSLPSGRPSTRADLLAARQRAASCQEWLDGWDRLPDEHPLPAEVVALLLEAYLQALPTYDPTRACLPGRHSRESVAAYARRQSWTVVSLRLLLVKLAEAAGAGLETLTEDASAANCEDVHRLLAARSDEDIALDRRTHALPDLAAIERLARYEAHLSRELCRTGRELDRLQTARRLRQEQPESSTGDPAPHPMPGPHPLPEPQTPDPRTTPEPPTTSDPHTMSDPHTTSEPQTKPDPRTTSEPQTKPDPRTTSEPQTISAPHYAHNRPAAHLRPRRSRRGVSRLRQAAVFRPQPLPT